IPVGNQSDSRSTSNFATRGLNSTLHNYVIPFTCYIDPGGLWHSYSTINPMLERVLNKIQS
ncbi:MAG TPA: hypothetical protein VKA09_16080, partial [Nitrososphaeraceae archaeon]|nr:hypothetical protein [Nitrososphaeraceae archaeon]